MSSTEDADQDSGCSKCHRTNRGGVREMDETRAGHFGEEGQSEPD